MSLDKPLVWNGTAWVLPVVPPPVAVDPAAMFGVGLLGTLVGTFLGVVVARDPARALRFLERLVPDAEPAEFSSAVRRVVAMELEEPCFRSGRRCAWEVDHGRAVALRPALRLVP